MGRRPKNTFFQKGHAYGEQTHEKMLNMANYQNYNEILVRMTIIKKTIEDKYL